MFLEHIHAHIQNASQLFENALIEELLEFLITVVNAELLKTVVLKIL